MLYNIIAKIFDLPTFFCRFNHYPPHLLTLFNKNSRQISLSDGQNKRQKIFSCVRTGKKNQKNSSYSGVFISPPE
jgi:hypothetical protein